MTLHLTDTALASLATVAARELPGVVAVRAEATPERVRVTIVTRMGDNCRDLAAAVQRAVTRTLAELAGQTTQVEVTVADVLVH